MGIKPTEIADDVARCARAWEPSACLIGNVTAANLRDLVDDYKRLERERAELRRALQLAHDQMVTRFSSEYAEHPASKAVRGVLDETR